MPRRRPLLLAATVAFLTCGLPAPAGAAPARVETIDVPSRHVDVRTAVLNGERPPVLRANVRLPDGYDPARAYPLLLLLHGVGDRHTSWAEEDKGRILETAAGLDAIVVMPEAGRGFYTNWWNGGRRGDPGWERYHLDELLAEVERRYRVREGRRWRAVGGLSMGGFGALYYASQRPGSFGTAFSTSGFVSVQRPQLEVGVQLVGGVSYTDIFGPREGFYAAGHNPVRLVENLRHTRLVVRTGTGQPRPGAPTGPGTAAAGVVESELFLQNEELAGALRRAEIPVDYRAHLGVHEWTYWREDLREALDLGLFREVEPAPTDWSFRTTSQTGEVWGLRFRFAAPPEEVVRLSRDGAVLRGEGSGTVALTDAAGCRFTLALPGSVRLPGPGCGRRVLVGVGRTRIRSGRRTVLHVRVRIRDADGDVRAARRAKVRLGPRVARTDPRGRARLVLRHGGRPRVVRLGVRVAGLPPVSRRLRVTAR